MSSYSVQVTITSRDGATVYPLSITQGDDTPGNVAPAYGLADPLTITQSLSDDPRAPLSHPDPEEATITLIAPNSTTYADLALGDAVGILVYPVRDFQGTPVEFYGRVAALTGDPHPLGVKLTLQCVDYTTDLAEIPVGGAVAYPLETVTNRINRITDEASLPRLPISGAGFTTLAGNLVAARTAGWTDAYSLLRETLDSAAFVSGFDENGTAYAGTHSLALRPVLAQVITAGQLDPATPFRLRLGPPTTRRIAYAPPARLVNVAGVYTVQVAAADSSPTTGAPTIAASRVTFAPQFTQSKSGGLPTVTIGSDAAGNRYTWDWRAIRNQWATGGAVFGPGGWTPYFAGLGIIGGPPVTQEVDSILDATDLNGPSGVAYWYRVPYRADSLAAWTVGTMRWNCWAEPETIYSWTGTANASTSQRRDNLGNVETNLHTDPLNATAGAPRLGFILNSGTAARDFSITYNGVVPSMKVTTTVDNWGYMPMDGTVNSGVQAPPTPALGKTLTFRCLVRSDTAQTVWARQYGTGGAANGPPVTLVANTWTTVQVTWTQAAGTGPFLSVRRQDGTALVGNVWLAFPMIVEGTAISDSPGWAPGYSGTPNVQWRRPLLTELLTVAGAVAGKLPNNREWLSGLVNSTVLTVAGGRVVLDIDVLPPSYDFVADREQLGASLGVVSMDSPIITGVTLAQLNARDTMNDYSLVRGS